VVEEMENGKEIKREVKHGKVLKCGLWSNAVR